MFTIKNTGDTLEFHEQFYETGNSRYLEYRKLLAEDSRNPSTILSKTIGAFLANLFLKPINKNDKQVLIPFIAGKFAEFHATCFEVFK